MSDNTRLVLYVTDEASDQPLPQHYLSLPDVVVEFDRYARHCGRCDRTWPEHDWVVCSASSPITIDCSRAPRPVPA